jgi:4-hydroxybenzoate polyprenyltransferase
VTARLSGIWRLTRFQEYVSFVVITTLLGAAASRGSLSWPLAGVLVANWLAVGFAFMINDVEDAPDDALNPAKVFRNPVSAGILSPRTGRLVSYLVACMSALVYATIGLGPFLAGLASLILGYAYSVRPLRLKAVPVADLISHGAMLAGLQFLAAYLAFEGSPTPVWIFPLGLVVGISLYGQLFQELRDFDGDLEAGVTHTASYIGSRATQHLMMAWLTIGAASGLVTFFVVRLVPAEILILIVALTGLLVGLRLRRNGRGHSMVTLHQSFQKPVEIATAAALAAWFVLPPVMAALGLAVTLPHLW